MRCDSRVFWLVLVVATQLHAAVAQRDVAVSRGKNGNRSPSSRTLTMELPSPADAKRRNTLQDDVFYCRAVSIASEDQDEYLVNFSLNNTEQVPLSRAPTMLVFGCTELPDRVKKLRDPTPLWDCDAICKYGERLLWTFSYEVGSEAFRLPSGSGYWVGGSSEIYYIVLQGKYDLLYKIDTVAFEELEKDVEKGLSASTARNSVVKSGADAGADAAQRVVAQIANDGHTWRPQISLGVTRVRPSRLVGVALLENTYGSLPPGNSLTYADASCAFKPPLRTSARIVAFRVHAHQTGRNIAGYMFNGSLSSLRGRTLPKSRPSDDYEEPEELTEAQRNASAYVFEIGARDPRLPQVFVNARPGLAVREGDKLFARCAFDTSARSARVEFGTRLFEEMCNFFVMYTFEADEMEASQEQYDAAQQYELEDEEYAATLREEADRRDLLPAFVYCASDSYRTQFELLVPRLTSLAQADAPAQIDEKPPQDKQTRTDGAFLWSRVHFNSSRLVAAGRHLVHDTLFQLPQTTDKRSITSQFGFVASSGRIGQVCGVATDAANRIYIFHRASLPPTRFLDWLNLPHPKPGANASDTVPSRDSNQFPLIAEDTVVVLDADGKLLESFGAQHFALPRAIHVDAQGNVYLADSYHHAVSVFSPTDRSKPTRVFGSTVLCGPSSILTDVDPENVDQLGVVHDENKGNTAAAKFIYVADGDCLSVSPSRVVKFSADGNLVTELRSGVPLGVSLAQHAFGDSLTLSAPSRLILHGPYLCVANREHANVVCWNRLDGALAAALDASELGDRLMAVSSVGKTFHLLAGTAVFCGVTPPAQGSNHSEGVVYSAAARLECGKMAGYSVDVGTGEVLDVWHAGFDLPVDVACASDGSFLVMAQLYPVGAVRKFVYETTASQSRSVGDLLAAAKQDGASLRRDKFPRSQNTPVWSLKQVSAMGGAMIAVVLVSQVIFCATCIACCCKKLRNGGVCGVKLASRRRQSAVKLDMDGEPLVDSDAESGGMVTDVAQMANEVVSKWRVGIADLKEAVGGVPRRSGFAALPQNDSETDEIIDTACSDEFEVTGASHTQTGRVSVNENVRRAARNERAGHDEAPSGAHIRFEHTGASKKVRFAVIRNGDVQEGATA